MGRFIGLAIKRDYPGSIFSNGGSGTADILSTQEWIRNATGITTDSNNNVTEITLGERTYTYIAYDSNNRITSFNQTIDNTETGWSINYDSVGLVTSIVERGPRPPESYSFNPPSATPITEGGESVTFSIATVGVDDGKPLYWSLVGIATAGDFSGSIEGQITNVLTAPEINWHGTASFTTPITVEDFTSEGVEEFQAKLYTDSARTNQVAISSLVDILDTSYQGPPGQQNFTSVGTYSFTVPPYTNKISILCIGGGAGGGGGGGGGYSAIGGAGGGGAYANDVTVTAGETLTVTVGNGGSGGGGSNHPVNQGGDGGPSKVERSGTALCHASAGTWSGHSSCNAGDVVVGDGGGLGGSDYTYSGQGVNQTNGGSTGGATGNGNRREHLNGNGYYSGGGGGYGTGGGGGGVGLVQDGSWGVTDGSYNGSGTYDGNASGGVGRYGGNAGSSGSGNTGGNAGDYGGGGGAGRYGSNGGSGGQGAVRIIWYGDRSFPSNHPDIFPTYNISVPSSVNEGATCSMSVTTTHIASGTTLYWDVATVSGATSPDFVSGVMVGTVTITNNTGTFAVDIEADGLTEGAETFKARLFTDSARTNQVAQSSDITINDTSSGTTELTSMTVVTHTSGGDGTTAQVTAPGGIQAGDLLIIMEYGPDVTSNIDGQIPTGFTKIQDAEHAAVDQRIHYKIATGSESGTTYTGQTGSNENMWIGVFRGNVAITGVQILASLGVDNVTNPSINMGASNPSNGKQLIFVSNGTRSASTCNVNPSDPSSGWTTYDHIESGSGNEVQGIAWNFPGTSWDGVVNCSGSYGSSSRNTIVGCILDLSIT